MRETRLSGSEGGGTEFNRFSLPLSFWLRPCRSAVSVKNDWQRLVVQSPSSNDPFGYFPFGMQ